MKTNNYHNTPYANILATDMSNAFDISQESAYNIMNFMNKHSLHDTLSQVLSAESKIYELKIEIPFLGTLEVKRDKENNIEVANLDLVDNFKSDIIKTMDGTSVLTEFIDSNMVKSIKSRYNKLL